MPFTPISLTLTQNNTVLEPQFLLPQHPDSNQEKKYENPLLLRSSHIGGALHATVWKSDVRPGAGNCDVGDDERSVLSPSTLSATDVVAR